MIDKTILRPCRKCGTLFTGLFCRKCKNKSSLNWNNNNKEKVLIAVKKYYDAHPEAYRVWQREYRRKIRSREIPSRTCPKNPEDAIRWKKKNARRYKIKNQISAKINSGEIRKPKLCPGCGYETLCRKMYIQLDVGLKFTGFLCSFCVGTKLIQSNINKENE